MVAAFIDRGFVVDDKESLFADEGCYLCKLFLRIFAFDETGVERCLGSVRNDVGGLLADVAAANAANVQRRLLQQLHQFFAVAFSLRDS